MAAWDTERAGSRFVHYVLGSDSVFRNRKASGSWHASDLLVLLNVSPHFNKCLMAGLFLAMKRINV